MICHLDFCIEDHFADLGDALHRATSLARSKITQLQQPMHGCEIWRERNTDADIYYKGANIGTKICINHFLFNQ